MKPLGKLYGIIDLISYGYVSSTALKSCFVVFTLCGSVEHVSPCAITDSIVYIFREIVLTYFVC